MRTLSRPRPTQRGRSLRVALQFLVCALLLPLSLVVSTAHAQTPGADLLYVCVQDDARIAVIDMNSRRLVRTIDLAARGFSPTSKPHHIAVEPDGSHWYVSLIGANLVLKFNSADSVVARFEMETPGMLSLQRDGELLAISRSMSAVNPPPRVAMVRRTTMQGDELDVLFPRPHPMLVSPNGYAYTGSLGVNQIASISTEDDRVQLVRLDGATHSFVQFAISPDGTTLVGSGDLSGELLVFSLSNPARPALLRSVPVGAMAFDPAFTPDGNHVWVPVKSRNQIVVLRTSDWSVVRTINAPLLQQPHQIVFSRDGAVAFVTNNNKMDHMADPAHAGHVMPGADGGNASLVMFNTTTGEPIGSIELGKNLTGMATRAR